MTNIKQDILSDVRVKLTEMFDRNFTEQGFFGQKWVPTRASKVNALGQSGSILIVSSAMRRSIRSIVRGDAVVFTSDKPYTALHNEGGTFTATIRQHTRKSKKGGTHTVHSHSRTVTMPQRQFIGDHERVQKAVGDIVYKNVARFSEELAKKLRQK